MHSGNRSRAALIVAACVSACLAGSSSALGAPFAETAFESSREGYILLARESYENAARTAVAMRESVQEFLAVPGETSMNAARQAWIAGREAYGQTEVFRFSGGPIDGIHSKSGVEGPEGRINSWPVDEAYLDSVRGDPRAGLIQDVATAITPETLASRNGSRDEAEVTLGFHAIEFLLWGQDEDPSGPGARSFGDYAPGDEIRERRRACLALLVDLLIQDLDWVASEWGDGLDRYAAHLRELEPLDALSRMLSGPATLAGFELASERIGVPLASRSQEDEHSCFSDTTHLDLAANIAGLSQVLEGTSTSSGLLVALEARDPEAAAHVRARIGRVRELIAGVTPPFDRILVAPADDPERRRLGALSGELLGLAGELREFGKRAGIEVVIGGGG